MCDEAELSPEQFAAIVISKSLAMPVDIHDDGSANAMFDLRIGATEEPAYAIEVTRSVDPAFAALWGVQANHPVLIECRCNWMVSVDWKVDARVLRRDLPPLMSEIEELGLTAFAPIHIHRQSPSLYARLKELKIEILSSYEADGPSTLSIVPKGSGGTVDDSGEAFVTWLSAFVGESKRSDNLLKLERSNAKRRELYILVSFGGAPSRALGYLNTFRGRFPKSAPRLPKVLSGVWVSSFARQGIYWDGRSWCTFENYLD